MRDVLFASWPLDPSLVAAHVPESLSVDTHDGSAWITAVTLEDVDARPWGFPAAAGVDFPEVNFHTKVSCDGAAGIYYFSVDVGSLLGTAFPRLFHHAPYHYAAISKQSDGNRTRFRCRRRHPGSRPVHFDATYGPLDGEVDAGADSLARFLVERYRFFTERGDGTLYSAAERHVPWPLYRAEAAIRRNTLFRANGFADPAADPVCYYSPGVDSEMSRCLPWRSRTTA